MKVQAAPFTPAMVKVQMIRPGMIIPGQPGQMVPMVPIQPGQMMPGMTFIPVSYPMMRAQMQYPINQNQVYQGMPGFQPMAQPQPQQQPLETNNGKSCVCYTPLFGQEHNSKL